ncbi:hypothetical protein [Lederbergia ruris]|uniref:Uncharacterized protein n=1 Tax=Lederbergia ruris TaxID=217495 RepID=A0ABQ4KDW2_9BACI|nr:hypothetical protein [Lederbergia ruris]GIN56155.1 hypothetical protein J8TS2_04740 [Lederbergia ruris]
MAMSIEEKRKQVKEFVDKLDQEQLEKYYKQMFFDTLEEEELTDEEIKEINEGLEEIKRGETYSFEEVFGDSDV